jgi:hypothetical protein
MQQRLDLRLRRRRLPTGLAATIRSSSHRAAADVERTPPRATLERVLALGDADDLAGRTSHGTGRAWCGTVDRYAMARRLPELKRDNLARREDPSS